MSNEINLLYTKRQSNQVKLSAKLSLTRYIALGFLSLTGLAAIVIFLLVLASPLPSLKTKEDTLIHNLSLQNTKILKMTMLSQRLSDITTIMNKRVQPDKIMDIFRQGIPPNATMKTFSLDQKTINLTLTSQDLTDITTYDKSLIALTKEKRIIKDVELTDLSADTGQPFEATYTITLL